MVRVSMEDMEGMEGMGDMEGMEVVVWEAGPEAEAGHEVGSTGRAASEGTWVEDQWM